MAATAPIMRTRGFDAELIDPKLRLGMMVPVGVARVRFPYEVNVLVYLDVAVPFLDVWESNDSVALVLLVTSVDGAEETWLEPTDDNTVDDTTEDGTPFEELGDGEAATLDIEKGPQ